MDIKLFVTVSLLLLLTSHLVLSEGLNCFKSFPSGTPVPDDTLMKAFYAVDLTNGPISMTYDDVADPVSVRKVNSLMDYDTWLAQTHSARTDMVNLWSYLTHMIVSDMAALRAHKKLVQQTPRPIEAVDLTRIRQKFANISGFWNSLTYSEKNGWPYKCFSECFFEQMTVAIQFLDYKTFTKSNIDILSPLGPDTEWRRYALELFFSEGILEFIPVSAQEGLFKNSAIHWNILQKLSEGTASFNEWLNGPFADALSIANRICTADPQRPVAAKYFCKFDEYMTNVRQCVQSDGAVNCLYESRYLDYFKWGEFINLDQLRMVNSVIDATKQLLINVKNAAVNNDRIGLLNFYNKLKPHITIDDTECYIGWPSKFDCVKNEGCESGKPDLEFDCNGGDTCRLYMIQRFDCLLKFVLKPIKALIDASANGGWSSTNVKKARNEMLIWLSFVPYLNYVSMGHTYAVINDVINVTQRALNGYILTYDAPSLKNYVINLPPLDFAPKWVKLKFCRVETVARDYIVFCRLQPLIETIRLFTNAVDSSKSRTRVINPTVNYPELLNQLQLNNIASFINKQTQNLFNALSNELRLNFGALSNYFSTLANFDLTKVNSDIGYIAGALDTFKTKINSLSSEIETKFTFIYKLALGINSVELVGKAALVTAAAITATNPVGALIGSSSLLDMAIMANDLAQAGVTTTITATLGKKTFSDVTEQGDKLGKGFAKNKDQLLIAKALIDQLKVGGDASDIAANFLGKYDSYTPQVLASDITAYGTLFATASDQLCEAAFSAETMLAAAMEIGLATTGDCTKISSLIEELTVLYEELYDYQFDLMDALADAARAALAHQKALDMKKVYTEGPVVDLAFLQTVAVHTHIISVLHLWEVVTEYCDTLTYTRGGVVPDRCRQAVAAPSNYAVAQVIAYRPEPLCHINNEVTDFRQIPVKPSGSDDTAFIDLAKLYSRKTVPFKIPNFQWLKDNNWVGDLDQEKAIYIKRFELFLPPMNGSQQHLVSLEVQPDMSNYLRYGGIKYLLPISGFTTRYTENANRCYNLITGNPYSICTPLRGLCITSNGYVDRQIQPSIFNEWKVKALAIPPNQTAPNPKTDFKLLAGVTMCMLDLAPSVKKRSVSKVSLASSVRTKRGSSSCCGANQYWGGSVCKSCPAGSTKKLNGYYCE